MSAAIDYNRWGRRPSPRTLEELATIARRGHHRLRASVRLHDGRHGEVFFDGATVLHAKLGWALGRRALDGLRAAEPFELAVVQLHATSDVITLGVSWTRRLLVPEGGLPGDAPSSVPSPTPRMAPRMTMLREADAATPRLPRLVGTRGVETSDAR